MRAEQQDRRLGDAPNRGVEAGAVAAGDVSSLELVEACLQRIEAVNTALNAVVKLDADSALAQARAADAARAGGLELGPLHGVPMTIKDSLDTAGMVTTYGTLGRKHFVPDSDATVVRRLREAGAILMGYPVISDSTTTPEIRPTGVTVREEIVVETDYDKLVPTCIDTRAVKVKIEKIDIPVGYAAAFEGERVRKDDMHVQFGFKYSDSVEYAKMVEPADIQDGDVELIGPDIDTVEPGGAMPMAIGVPMTAAALLDTMLVRIPIISIRLNSTTAAGAPKVMWTNRFAR